VLLAARGDGHVVNAVAPVPVPAAGGGILAATGGIDSTVKLWGVGPVRVGSAGAGRPVAAAILAAEENQQRMGVGGMGGGATAGRSG